MKLFPDDIVCCGPASVFVPYTDPGLRLSQVIRNETTSLLEEMALYPVSFFSRITVPSPWDAPPRP